MEKKILDLISTIVNDEDEYVKQHLREILQTRYGINV